MKRDGHTAVKFFIGSEIEHTPAHGMKTLFVVGLQDVSRIQKLAKQNECEHIYFGANQSFPRLEVNDGNRWQPWERMILDCLEAGWLCTLDIDHSCVEGLLESRLVEERRFIPMISVKLPYIRQLGYNATLKLDDKDFDATNPGVWCHSLHSLQRRSAFTDWSEYRQDKVLK